MYAHGQYVKKDIYEAISLYLDACEMGEASGCNNLGYMYEVGSGVAEDEMKAEKFYTAACELNDRVSCNRLGTVYGKRVQEIKSQADLDVAQKSCGLGNPIMCYKVGLYLEKKKEESKARTYFERACDGGESQSCKHLGDLHR